MCLRSFKIRLPPASPSLWRPRRVSLVAGVTGGTGTSVTLSCVRSLFWAPKSLVTHPENSEDVITEDLGYLMSNWRETSGIISQVRLPRFIFSSAFALLHAPSSPLPPAILLGASLESFHTVCPFSIPTASCHHAPFWLSSPFRNGCWFVDLKLLQFSG